MSGSWSIYRGNHRCLVEIEGDLLPYRLAVHREGLWGLSIGLFLNGEKKLTISWQSDLSILVYEHGLQISILVYEHGSEISILVYEHGSEISILVYEHGGKSLSSICFLPYWKNWTLRINISDKIKSILFADLPFQNVALKRNRTKNHTSLIEKSIDPEITLLVFERVLIHLSRKSSIPGWDRGRFASL